MADQQGVKEKETMLETGEAATAYTDKNMDKEHANEVKKKKILTVSLAVLNVVMIVILLILVMYWKEVRRINMEPRQQNICLNCDEMGLNFGELPSEAKGKISRELKPESAEEYLCCGQTSNVLDWLVAKAIKDRSTTYHSDFLELESKKCKQTTKVMPSAQVNGISASEMAQGTSGVIHWHTTASSFMKGGITYKDGTLSIQQPGYYYIFTQIIITHNALDHPTIEVKHAGTELLDDTRVNHYIHHHSAKTGSTRKILEGSKSRCEITSSRGETASSIGAVFYLEENDGLFVNISHPRGLVPSHEGNNFGLYMT